jgi:hypothetical protein
MTWKNVQDDCLLCEMDKRTEWYLETKDWVVAEKLGGGPFIVYKRHQTELSDEEWDDMERVAGRVFDDFDVRVIMSHCPNHWHGHLRNYTFTKNFK